MPPKVRSRFGGVRPVFEPDPPPPEPPPPAARPAGPSAFEWVGEFSRLGLLFLAVAVGNLVFLLVALSFLTGGPPTPAAIPGR